jgi:DNA-binding CsgD family transcriptional regulator
MPRVSVSDYQRVLDVLYEAGGVEGQVPFPEAVLVALRCLVPCEVVTYHAGSGGGTPAIAQTGQWRGDWTAQLREVDARTWHQDGLVPTWGARKISDYLTQREFHRLELYQDVSRVLGIEYMMRLWLDSGGADGARLEFDRTDHDFDERDRAVLDLLLPHLAQFRRRAAVRAPADPDAAQLTPREREILELVGDGRTNAEIARSLWLSTGTVRKHLENAYEKLDVHTRTGAVAAAFGSSVQNRKDSR